MLDQERERSQQEYEVLLFAFMRLLDAWEDGAGRMDILEDLITSRASFLIDRTIESLNLNFDQALDLLRNHNSAVTLQQKQERDILVAAIDNLVDFAVAEEWTMYKELPEEMVEENRENCVDHFRRYNLTGAVVENSDVIYAAAVAAWWIGISEDTYMTFMTQGDERVRAWHLDHEGRTYRKSEFPPELIPPIEWGCRCYLITSDASRVHAKLSGIKPQDVHPVFRESLATCGRIFSLEHPFFCEPLPPPLVSLKRRIKSKFSLP